MNKETSEEQPREQERGWYFPVAIVKAYDSGELTASQILLLGKINSLCHYKKGCWASNHYLAEWWGKTKMHVSKTIRKLEEAGFLQIKKDKSTGRRAIHVTFQGDDLARKKAFASRQRGVCLEADDRMPRGRCDLNSEASIGEEKKKIPKKKTGQCSFDVEAESSIERVCNEFANWSASKGLHRGRKGSTRKGWTARTIRHWKRPLEDLLEQVGNMKEIERTMKWYFDHYGEDFVPIAETLSSFIERYSKFERAREKSENPTFRSNGHPRPAESRDRPRYKVHGVPVPPEDD